MAKKSIGIFFYVFTLHSNFYNTLCLPLYRYNLISVRQKSDFSPLKKSSGVNFKCGVRIILAEFISVWENARCAHIGGTLEKRKKER